MPATKIFLTKNMFHKKQQYALQVLVGDKYTEQGSCPHMSRRHVTANSVLFCPELVRDRV